MKKLVKCLIIISLIIIIIFAFTQIRKTLARYETTATAQKDVDVAFWVVGNDIKTGRILVDDIYPRNEPFEYTFTVSNFNEAGKRAETDLEYDIIIKASTYLPLNYEVAKKETDGTETTCIKDEQLYIDENNTYYRQIRLKTTENNLTMDCNNNKTDTFVVKITFPPEYSTNADYADLMEDIKIELSARQIIGE